jgi:multidrug efflux pump subunit AcrA (membrane-fusion protein)
MTLVGKIFTMLIFVLSIVFMAFSIMVFATHRNWKTFAGKLQADLAVLQTQKKDVDDALLRTQNDLAAEQAARRAALASLQVRVTRAEQLLAAKEKELADATSQLSGTTEAAKQAQERLLALETETKKLRDDLRGAQEARDEMLVSTVALTESLNQAQSQLNNLQEVNKEATFEMGKMKQVLSANGLTPDALVAHIPPKVDGVILEESDKNLIVISIGADDGLKIGHELDVYNGSSYLGRIKIRRTMPDRAVGEPMRNLQSGQMKRGDRVTTRFS